MFGYVVIERGVGEFGPIYSGIRGQDAVNFLLQAKSGEVLAAFMHSVLGPIDLVWGVETVGERKGFGLAKIIQKHPEAIHSLTEAIKNSEIVEELPDRRVLLSRDHDQQSVIDLQFNNKSKKWLLTSYFLIKIT